MQRWEILIDAASKTCGSQNKLAATLGITGPNMSQARNGRRRLTTDQVARMAEIVGVPAAEVWLAQEDYRNPFRVIETAAVAILSVLFLFTLPSESRASARVSDAVAGIDHTISERPPYT